MRKPSKHDAWPRRLPLRPTCWLLGGVIGVAACGCQRDSRDVDVHGTVTFAGAPVPAGQVIIQPDGGKGNSGPQGFALIRNGQFDTAADHGKRTVRGAVKVLVSGGGGVGVEALKPYGRKLFEEYQLTAELSSDRNELKIEVPAAVRTMSANTRQQAGQR